MTGSLACAQVKLTEATLSSPVLVLSTVSLLMPLQSWLLLPLLLLLLLMLFSNTCVVITSAGTAAVQDGCRIRGSSLLS